MLLYQSRKLYSASTWLTVNFVQAHALPRFSSTGSTSSPSYNQSHNGYSAFLQLKYAEDPFFFGRCRQKIVSAIGATTNSSRLLVAAGEQYYAVRVQRKKKASATLVMIKLISCGIHYEGC